MKCRTSRKLTCPIHFRNPSKMGEYISLITGLGCGIIVGWFLKQGKASRVLPLVPKVGANKRSVTGQHKLILVVRMDLKMGKGKVAAHCAHATLEAYNRALQEAADDLKSWRRTGQAKVVVKVEDKESLLEVERSAQALGLNTALVCDAGRTQTPPGSFTVLGVGPARASLLDEVTGHLKLL